MKPTSNDLQQGDVLTIEDHPHHNGSNEFTYIAYCKERKKAVFWKGISALFFFREHECKTYATSWKREINDEWVELIDKVECTACTGTGSCKEAYCKGTGFVDAEQELEPVFTLDNPVINCMANSIQWA